MKLVFKVQSMTDSGENINVFLAEETNESAPSTSTVYGTDSLNLTLTKSEAAPFFPGKKFDVTLAEVTV